MPNWCNNKLAVYGPDADVKRFKQQALGHSPWQPEEKPNVFNLHSLVPVPPDIIAAGYETAGYDWEREHWGCKWGACHAELADEWEGHLTYTFDTAGPRRWPVSQESARNGPLSSSCSITRRWAWASRASAK